MQFADVACALKNANCYILGEDVKWRGGCARRRGADFILSVKWLCAPRGPERRAGFFFEQVRALVRGAERFFIKANVLF